MAVCSLLQNSEDKTTTAEAQQSTQGDDQNDEKDCDADDGLEEEAEATGPVVIRGAAKKRKREEPTIPFAGGEETRLVILPNFPHTLIHVL